MALTNYSDLVTAISSWTHRGDLASIAPDLITLAEQRIYYGSQMPGMESKPLRLRIMEEQDTGNAASGVITIPTGYLETIRLVINTGGKQSEITYRAPVANAPYETEAGNASFFTRINEGLKVAPSSAAYVHDYYKRFDALTSTATTNALMTAHPNIYLYACLVEAWIYASNLPKAQWAFSMFASAVNSHRRSDKWSALGAAPAVVAVS
jgi:hypothetical protein